MINWKIKIGKLKLENQNLKMINWKIIIQLSKLNMENVKWENKNRKSSLRCLTYLDETHLK